MQDQVNQLEARGIKAAYISSHLFKSGIDRLLDNACYDPNFKFLYVSPERLRTHLFKERLKNMPLNLIAVDEAHCISEWGHDFRPDYRLIHEVREIKKETPIIALTATATPKVVQDISEQLGLKEVVLFKKSFRRENIAIHIEQTKNKNTRLREWLSKNKESGIIYCNTRKHVKSLYKLLFTQSFSVDFYHGGLNYHERNEKQARWIQGDCQVMICTNAFGMGIDKSNVRFVVHYDLPDSPEAYFQEIGRAGRDGQASAALALIEPGDIQKMKERHLLKFPSIEEIRQIYKALGNYFQLPIGSGKEEYFPLELSAFCHRYELGILKVHNTLKLLELAGFLKYMDQNEHGPRIHFTATKKQLYAAQIKDEKLNVLIQQILRTHLGVFEDFVSFNDFQVRRKTGFDATLFQQLLERLKNLQLAEIEGSSKDARIVYLTERLNENNLSIPPEILRKRKEASTTKLEAITSLVQSNSCFQSSLLVYFGEEEVSDCGVCQNCQSNQQQPPSPTLESAIIRLLKKESTASTQGLITALPDFDREAIIQEVRTLSDHQIISVNEDGSVIELN